MPPRALAPNAQTAGGHKAVPQLVGQLPAPVDEQEVVVGSEAGVAFARDLWMRELSEGAEGGVLGVMGGAWYELLGLGLRLGIGIELASPCHPCRLGLGRLESVVVHVERTKFSEEAEQRRRPGHPASREHALQVQVT